MSRVYSPDRVKKSEKKPDPLDQEPQKPRNLKEYSRWMKDTRGVDLKRYTFPRFLRDYNSERGWDTPKFHLDIAKWLDRTSKHDRRMLMAYRGASKRHIICLYAVYLLWKNPQDSIMIVSAAKEIAARNSFFIKQVLERFSLVSNLIPQKGGDHWRKEGLNIDRFHVEARYSLTILSLDSRGTGSRSRLCILDDAEVSENAHDQEKLRRQISEYTMMTTDWLVVGTYHSSDSLYDHLMRQTEFEFRKWAIWKDPARRITQNPNVMINGAYQDALWADKIKSRITLAEWNSQYLLIPDDMASTRFDASLLQFFRNNVRVQEPLFPGRPTPHDYTRYFISEDDRIEIKEIKAYWDPASGRIDRDASVLAIVAATMTNRVYVLRCVALPPVDESCRFTQQCETVLDELDRFHLHTCFVEQNFSIMLASELRRVARVRSNRALNVVNVHRSCSKQNFIPQAIEPLLTAQKLYVHERVEVTRKLLPQIKEWSPRIRHDDSIDSVAGAINELSFKKELSGSERSRSALGGANLAVKFNRYQPLQKRAG